MQDEKMFNTFNWQARQLILVLELENKGPGPGPSVLRLRRPTMMVHWFLQAFGSVNRTCSALLLIICLEGLYQRMRTK